MYKFSLKHNEKPAPEYATRPDLCENLLTNLQPLYVLALLLTGTHTEAEQCFVTTIEVAISTKSIFKGWESSWSKRCLIINAVGRVFRPNERPGKQQGIYEGDVERGRCTVDTVASLAPMQRFVFVITVLEKYSEHECALLLGCTSREVREARIQALRQVPGFHPVFERIAG
jgi:hypothetical protein